MLYVAITRAEKCCTLTYARSRYRYGKMEFDTPSRFLRDIDPRLITAGGGSHASFNAPASRNKRPLFGSMPEYGRQDVPTPSYGTLRSMTKVSTPHTTPTRSTTESKGDAYLTVGTAVMHDRFGKGVIRKIEGTGESTKATVDFENAGTKQLLLKFAKLKTL